MRVLAGKDDNFDGHLHISDSIKVQMPRPPSATAWTVQGGGRLGIGSSAVPHASALLQALSLAFRARLQSGDAAEVFCVRFGSRAAVVVWHWSVACCPINVGGIVRELSSLETHATGEPPGAGAAADRRRHR